MDTGTLGLRGTRQAYARASILSLALLGLVIAQPLRAETVTADNLMPSIANAKTAEDHEAIAKYYEGRATDARSQAEAHKAMLKAYDNRGTGKEQMTHGVHCKDAIRSYENLAKDYDGLAKEHEQMAKAAKGK